MLEINDLKAGYNDNQILHGIDLTVSNNEIVSIIGPNGCGKSTLLRAIMGMTIWSTGGVKFQSGEILGFESSQIVAGGVGYVPQLSNVFAGMSVLENLQVGGYLLKAKERSLQIELMLELFPKFQSRQSQQAGTMSGGERQSLALAMAMMTSPKLMLLDEPSAGLSPKATREMYDTIVRLQSKMGMSVLIVEQDVHGVLEITDRTYVLKMGQNDFDGPSKEILEDDRIRSAYLGSIDADSKSKRAGSVAD